ncbi:hypothetical protein AMS69_18020 [Haloarcula rubripromontorii]|uniref:Uncharacterized protein n=1 Tax=Haloarcula rubripromontorii TaxID=1705562 RepID=A0A0M9AHM0_9EURY|nr:hypothetical protein [Haloarcula rubripromontorii]KOX91618.1 hypothetical protein AMS69_18020 [Haloarcula rubripromontorii]
MAATTGLTIGLAGCSSSDQDNPETNTSKTDADGDGSSDTSSGGIFGEIGFEGRELKVTVSDDTVARINVVQDGEQVGSGEFSTGVSTATVWSANQTLHGEEFELIAVDEEDNAIASTSTSFSAQTEVSRLRTQALKNDREATEEAAEEYTEEFGTALVTIENTGDGPLFINRWGAHSDSAVFLTDGVPNTTTPAEADERPSDPSEKVLVPANGSAEVVPFRPQYLHVRFVTPGGKTEHWPESVRSMGEFPDEYADGDEVDVSVVVRDDTGEQIEATLTATYDGGILEPFNVPAEFST